MTQKTFTLLSIVFIGLSTATAQTDFNRTINPEFEKDVDSYLNYSVPAITVKNLIQIKDDVILLDARETKEYEVSHIPGARYVGFDDFDNSVLYDIDKDNRIVVYCSIGFRSEKIGEKLKKLGYFNTYNLFGSIFEWVNAGQQLEDKNGRPTNKVHTYNKKWSKWVTEGTAEKVW